VSINKRNYKAEINFDHMLELTLVIEEPNMTYACSTPSIIFSFDPGLPQPGDLLYRLSDVGGIDDWIPGHVGIYVGELEDEKGDPYNVIEALGKLNLSFIHLPRIEGKVEANYYNPITEFADKFNTTYMGTRQPKGDALTSEQRKDVLEFLVNNEVVGKPYAGDETIKFFWGMARGNKVKGDKKYNCVGLAEAAYEAAQINGGVGLVTEEDEGNINCNVRPKCLLTPAEQYKETEPAEGYTISGQVTDSQGNGIPDVTLNLELVNDYHPDPIELTTNSDGYWSSDKLGREWNVTPQKDGYTFEPSTIKVKENANDINFTSTSEPEILTPEEIELIRKWGYGGDYVVRWPDGYVDVYDETNYSRMQEIINEWNVAIGGPVILRLSSNPNSPVKVIFDSSLEEENLCYHVDWDFGENYDFSKIILNINPKCLTYGYPLYLHPFNAVAGFNAWADVDPCPFEDWSNFNTIPDIIKTMLRALHRVPPGYYLGKSKQIKDDSNAIIKNVFTSGGDYLDEGKK